MLVPTDELPKPALKTLNAVQGFINQNGFPPTVEELADVLSKTKATIHANLATLMERGYIIRHPARLHHLRHTSDQFIIFKDVFIGAVKHLCIDQRSHESAKCNRVTHQKIGAVDLTEWYRRYCPDFDVGSVVPADCFDCWQAAGGTVGAVVNDNETVLIPSNSTRTSPSDGPLCPRCGQLIRTTKAQQCFHCWTDLQ